MAPVLYRWPNTGDNVQAWVADDPDDDDHTYVQAIPEGHTEQGNRAVTVAKIRCRARWGCVVRQGMDRSTRGPMDRSIKNVYRGDLVPTGEITARSP